MNVLRLEHPEDGLGAYHSFYAPPELDSSAGPNRPTFVDEIGEYERKRYYADHSGYYFGFQTMEQVADWFSPCELHALWLSGFRLLRFRVRKGDVLIGGKQVAFRRKFYKPVGRIEYDKRRTCKTAEPASCVSAGA